MHDTLNTLAGLTDDGPLTRIRGQRDQATTHTQRSYLALFHPASDGGVSALERAAVALRVAAWHGEPRLIDHYRGLLAEAGGGPDDAAAVVALAAPPGELTPRLAAELEHADLLATHPADARPQHLARLTEAGLDERAIVIVSQLIAYVSFQARVLMGLLLLAGQPRLAGASSAVADKRRQATVDGFTQDQLGWLPWISPLPEGEETREQEAALPGPRARSPYFRLLAREAPVLVERTATDEGTFRSPGGLPRAERELAAVVASRVNGCTYCASVHSRFASTYSGRGEDVQRLLDEGIAAPQDDRWRALLDFGAALSQTPPLADEADLLRLRELGLDDLQVLDLVQATAFFAWANRLMLTLGEPTREGAG